MNDAATSTVRRKLVLAAGAGALVAPFKGFAQGISTKPVRIILGQTAATTPDLIARLLAQRLQAKWNQAFVVENRGGAGGAIGLDAVAKAPPDGHSTGVRLIKPEDEAGYQPRQFPFNAESFCMWGAKPDIPEFREKKVA